MASCQKLVRRRMAARKMAFIAAMCVVMIMMRCARHSWYLSNIDGDAHCVETDVIAFYVWQEGQLPAVRA